MGSLSLASLGTLVFRKTRWGGKDRKYERVALATDAASEQTPLSPRSHTHGLVGASSYNNTSMVIPSGHSRNLVISVVALFAGSDRYSSTKALSIEQLPPQVLLPPWSLRFRETLPHLRTRLHRRWSAEHRVEEFPGREGSSAPLGRSGFREQNPEGVLRPTLWTFLSTSTNLHHLRFFFTLEKEPVLSWDRLKFWAGLRRISEPSSPYQTVIPLKTSVSSLRDPMVPVWCSRSWRGSKTTLTSTPGHLGRAVRRLRKRPRRMFTRLPATPHATIRVG
jgi:hypothetical protein